MLRPVGKGRSAPPARTGRTTLPDAASGGGHSSCARPKGWAGGSLAGLVVRVGPSLDRRRLTMRLGRSPRGQEAAALGLAEECEAFLGGAHVAYVQEEGWRMHPASWLNAIAHGDLAQIEDLAAGECPEPGHAPHSWPEARAVIARAVASTAPLPEELRALQRDVLVPLELELFAGDDGILPRRLVEVTLERVFGAGLRAREAPGADG